MHTWVSICIYIFVFYQPRGPNRNDGVAVRSRPWFLNHPPGLYGEMADAQLQQETNKMNKEYLVTPERKSSKIKYNPTLMGVLSKGLRNQLKEFPMVKAGIICVRRKKKKTIVDNTKYKISMSP